ncbi:MAG TPA: L,D-transpeptidase, partial [Verrucomicrobiae bacterium]|nr:L,D-transpeptidase [Verrucomicrobiae bacterium]
VAMNPTVDADKIKGFVATKVVAVASPPEPAKVVATGKNVVIEDQVPGLAVDDTELNRQLNAALVTSLDSDALSFRLPPRLSDAKITRTTVEPIATKWTALGDTKVSLTSSDVKLAPSREEILQWYIPVQSDKGEITLGLNAERIGTYLQKNGKTLDQKKSLAAVSKAAEDLLKTPKTSVEVAVVIKPTAEATAGEYKSGLFEGKYVYVNIKDQKLYRMNGQTMEKVYRISSGKWSTPTPRGTFKIAGKHPRAYSREYGLYMPYWQNFLGTSNDGEELPIGSYGLHELPEWPNGYKEGQGHLGTAVSHGCVRLGVGDAAEVYAWTETGTPVVIE